MKKRRIKQIQSGLRAQTLINRPAPPPKERRRWLSSLLQPKLLLIEIPGAFAVFVGFVALWNQAVPTIVPPTTSGDVTPLAIPFVIENQSSLWTFDEVTTTCTFDQLVWVNQTGTPMDSIFLEHPKPSGKISPGRSVTASCFLVTAMHSTALRFSGNLASARATIVVNYKIFGIGRTFTSQHFCWVPTPPSGHQWELCDRL